MAKKKKPAQAAQKMRAHAALVLSTRGITARHRHLQRDLLKLLPHAKLGAKMGAEQELATLPGMVEEANCDTAVLMDARDPRRLYMWLANCPGGPSAMFQVLNVHTVAELKMERRRAAGARTLLVFDGEFEVGAERKVMKELLSQAFAVPASGPTREHPKVQHTINFSWLDNRIWVRVYRVVINEALEKVRRASTKCETSGLDRVGVGKGRAGCRSSCAEWPAWRAADCSEPRAAPAAPRRSTSRRLGRGSCSTPCASSRAASRARCSTARDEDGGARRATPGTSTE